MNINLKKKSILIFLSLTTLVTFPSLANNKYYSTLDVKNVVIKKYTPEIPPKLSFEYITNFDISKSGSGYYYNNGTNVIMVRGTVSKPTFPISKNNADEARVRFYISGSSSYATQIRFVNPETNKTMFLWYNHDKIFYVYDQNSSLVSKKLVGGGVATFMEMRFNFNTNDYSFYVNDNLILKDNYNYSFPESVFANVFDGSGSGGGNLTLVDNNL